MKMFVANRISTARTEKAAYCSNDTISSHLYAIILSIGPLRTPQSSQRNNIVLYRITGRCNQVYVEQMLLKAESWKKIDKRFLKTVVTTISLRAKNKYIFRTYLTFTVEYFAVFHDVSSQQSSVFESVEDFQIHQFLLSIVSAHFPATSCPIYISSSRHINQTLIRVLRDQYIEVT